MIFSSSKSCSVTSGIMSSKYWQARIAQVPSSSKPRKAMKSPDRPIAFRQEYIRDSKYKLLIKPQGDAQSATAYKIIEEEDGILQFTVTGRKYGDRACREIRDSTGLPLFELHRKFAIARAANWVISLPGSDDATLATGAPRWYDGSKGNITMTVNNQAALDTKSEGDKQVKLTIERHGYALAIFDIVDGDRKVAEVRESVRHNEKLSFMSSSFSTYRPILELVIVPGVDLSLVSILLGTKA